MSAKPRQDRDTVEVDQPPRAGRARLVDVATLAGVSKSIASKVLNDYAELSVRPETRRRVLDAAASLGYRPHAGARALAGAETRALALLVPALTIPIYVSIIRGAYQRARHHGYLTLLAEDFAEQEADEGFRDLVEAGRVDGLLIASARPAHRLVDSLRRHPVPHVFVNRPVAGAASNVTMRVAATSHLALEHLTGLAHRSVGHIAGPAEIHPSRQREDAFRAMARQLRLASAPVARAPFSEEGGAAAAERLLARQPRATALYTSSLSQAIGAMHAVRRLGLRIPEDVSVISSDDLPLADYLSPPLTTIAMPLAELGAAAVDALVAQLTGQPARHVVIPAEPHLVVRSSTAPPPAR